jgi:hypothetical protein
MILSKTIEFVTIAARENKLYLWIQIARLKKYMLIIPLLNQ